MAILGDKSSTGIALPGLTLGAERWWSPRTGIPVVLLNGAGARAPFYRVEHFARMLDDTRRGEK
jgi:hypothetical protein